MADCVATSSFCQEPVHVWVPDTSWSAVATCASTHFFLPASVPIALVEVWAGVGGFSSAFAQQQYVAVEAHGLIEIDRAASKVLKASFPDAVCCSDFFSYQWRDWCFSETVVITGGPSCCHLSVAGKRLRESDPRADQGLETAKLSVWLQAACLLLENVCNLVDEDPQHQLLTRIIDYLAEHEYRLMAVFRGVDFECGGHSTRERVFPYFESNQMASALPVCSSVMVCVAGSFIRSVLDPVDEVEGLVVVGHLQRHAMPFARPGVPMRIGFISYRAPSRHTIGATLVWAGDSTEWRVVERADQFVRLLLDSRTQPRSRWLHLRQLQTASLRSSTHPVYSIDGASKTIRSTHFLPEGPMLINDTRINADCVRRVSARECWQLCSLPMSVFACARGLGVTDEELYRQAGNSIPQTLLRTPVETVAARVAGFVHLRRAQELRQWTLINWQPSLLCVAGSGVFLVMVVPGKAPRFLTSSVGMLPAKLGSHNQGDAFTEGCALAVQLGCSDAAATALILERSVGMGTLFTVVCPVPSAFECSVGLEWMELSGVLEGGTRELLAVADVQLAALSGHTSVLDTSWQIGRLSGHAAFDATAKDSRVEDPAFRRAVAKVRADEADLLRRLRMDDSELVSWAEAFTPLDLREVPPSLCRSTALPTFSGLLLSDPHEATQTAWLPLLPNPTVHDRPAPEGWYSAVVPERREETRLKVKEFERQMVEWLAGTGPRPSMMVVPGSALMPWAFEAIHEFRDGRAWPVMTAEPAPSHLDLDFLLDLLNSYPDQELVSHLALGVRYKADLAWQVVFQPHLYSFLPVQQMFLEEADRFVERGWTAVTPEMPCVPGRLGQCGHVVRKLEPDRPRGTHNGSAPHGEHYDSDGIQVVALNVAALTEDLPHEGKPTVRMLLVAMTVLLEVAALLDLTLFMITDDFKSFFNQLRLAPEEYWKTLVMHPPRPGQSSISYGSDRVLGFGLKMASNIAQRFANAIVHLLKQKVLPEATLLLERLAQQLPEVAEWRAQREALGEYQATLWFVLMYTDDPCFLCVGADMTFIVLKAWHWLTRGARTMMAIAAKRTIGSSAKWLGIQFICSLGLSYLTAQKIMRAITSIQDALLGRLCFDDYRSLVSFLEHVRDMLFLLGDKMYGLYRPFSEWHEPSTRVRPNPLMVKQLKRWLDRIVAEPGSLVSQLLQRSSGTAQQVSRPQAARIFHLYSDAAKEGTEQPGLGGWFCGYWWAVRLDKRHLELHITVLEAIAAVCNVIVISRLLGLNADPESKWCSDTIGFEAHVDALATVAVLIKGRARSQALQRVHQDALEVDAFQAMLPRLTVSHILGKSNGPADAASRGYLQVLRVIAKAMALHLVELEPPEEAHSMLDRALEFHRSEVDVAEPRHCWGARGTRVGEASHPGPMAFKRQRVWTPEEADPMLQPVPAPGPDIELPRLELGVTRRIAVHELSTAEQLAALLRQDDSPFRLAPRDPGALLQMCRNAFDLHDSGYALRTSGQDLGAWKAWSEYCESVGTTPWRADQSADRNANLLAYLREVVLLTGALGHFMRNRKPRSKVDTVIRPKSALQILYAVNRVHKRNFLSLIPLKAVSLALKGLMRKYLQQFGQAALQPKRREPWTHGMIRTLLDTPNGASMGALGSLDWSSVTGYSLRAAIAVAKQTGLRKAELFKSDDETHFLLVGNTAWYIGGKWASHAEVTQQQLAALTVNDCLVLRPPPSKADPFGVVWGPLPIYLHFRPEKGNAAAAVRDLLVKRALPREGPLFVTAAEVPITATRAAGALARMVSCFMPEATAKLYTWHSFRIFLACALLAIPNMKPSTIQALLRWQSDESLRAYARMSRTDQGRYLDAAEHSVIASVQTLNLPIYEQYQFYIAMRNAVEAAESDS